MNPVLVEVFKAAAIFAGLALGAWVVASVVPRSWWGRLIWGLTSGLFTLFVLDAMLSLGSVLDLQAAQEYPPLNTAVAFDVFTFPLFLILTVLLAPAMLAIFRYPPTARRSRLTSAGAWTGVGLFLGLLGLSGDWVGGRASAETVLGALFLTGTGLIIGAAFPAPRGVRASPSSH